jgi:hypothetical protein
MGKINKNVEEWHARQDMFERQGMPCLYIKKTVPPQGTAKTNNGIKKPRCIGHAPGF